MKKENGITLIALIVTIIIMMILAGISVKLVIDKNGIVSNAKEAKDQFEQSQYDDDDEMYELSDEMSNQSNSNRTGSSVAYGVKIPEGYYYVGGTKKSGIVISDNRLDEKIDSGKENVRRDLAGNQWVWVPVETPSSLYTTVSDEKTLSGSTGVTTKKYTKSEIINGQTRVTPGDASSYREPDLVVGDDEQPGYDLYNYSRAGFKSSKDMAETMVNEYDEMIRSIEKYKGFFIGRYELSDKGEKTGASKTCVMEGTEAITWYELYESCTKLAKGTKVKTRMIWGLQWDATCNWLDTSGFDITDSSAWGNYKDNTAEGAGTFQNTGYSESWKANNIYDFAGNGYEFTREAGSAKGRNARGGDSQANGATDPATDRGAIFPNFYGMSRCTTRPMLYIIP